ncbi:MAG: hypothetical protein ACXQS4_02485 [Methermicoccaceae archaeon]
MNENKTTIVADEHEYRVQAGFSVNPEYDSKGQLKSGVKLWMSCGFDDVDEAEKWLGATLIDAVRQCKDEMAQLKRGDE